MKLKVGLLLGLLIVSGSALAADVAVKGVRSWAAPDSTRVVLDVSGEVGHQLTSLSNPDRVVLLLDHVSLDPKILANAAPKGLLQSIAAKKIKGSKWELALRVAPKTTPKIFLLKPNEQYGYRLVVDLLSEKAEKAEDVVNATPTPAIKATTKSRSVTRDAADVVASIDSPISSNPEKFFTGGKPFVVAIDAGHGGEDPGAHGKSGTLEKEVTLSIARKLAQAINREPGMKAVLTRDGDYYVGLRQRMVRARQQKADLFVSIHADAFTSPDARGSSVFAVSDRGATSEAARWLAERENAADLVGGVSLDDKDHVLASVLLDLSQAATIESSMDLGGQVLRSMGQLGPLHRGHVERAGFMVLKSPDIPSILVETAFISNPVEERKLGSHGHQKKLAQAIVNGIKGYMRKAGPIIRQHKTVIRSASADPAPVSKPSRSNAKHTRRDADDNKKHVVAHGETVSSIARQYRVQPTSLKLANNIRGEELPTGRVLQIP